jgi:hypothetical protein
MGQQGVDLGNTMYGSAMGQGPSLAQQQSQQAVNKSMGGMYAYPTLNSALAARGAGNQAMGMMDQGAMARVAEQEKQRQLMSQYLLSQLQQRTQGQEANVGSKNYNDQLMMQQDLTNANGMTRGGGLGAFLGAMGSFMGGMTGSMGQMSQLGTDAYAAPQSIDWNAQPSVEE